MKEEIEKILKEVTKVTASSDPTFNPAPRDIYSDREKYIMLRGFLQGLITPINRDGGE